MKNFMVKWGKLLTPLTIVAFIVTMLTLVYISVFGGEYFLNQSCGPVYSLENGWSLDDGFKVTENLSTRVPLPHDGGKLLLRRQLNEPNDVFKGTPSLLFQIKYLNMEIYLDDVLLAAYDTPENGFTVSSGTLYFFADLPPDWYGKELKVYCEPLLDDNVNHTFSAPEMGVRSDILFSKIYGELMTIVVDIAMAVLGVVLLCGGVVCFKNRSIRNPMVYTGFFAMFFAAYDLCLMVSTHLFIRNTYLLYTVELVSLMLVGVPLMLLSREYASNFGKSLLNVSTTFMLANFSVQIAIHFLFKYEFRQMLVFTHASLILGVVALVCGLLLGKDASVNRKRFVMSTLPLVIGGFVDVIRFYLSWSQPLNLMFRLGTLFFVITQLLFIIQNYLAMCKVDVESEYLRTMAYKDSMTQLANRAAFDRDASALMANPGHSGSLWCVSVDVNDLKRLNDAEGHLAGDILIKKAAKVLNTVFGKFGIIYRVGGDEFVVLLYNTTQDNVSGLVERMFDEQNKSNVKKPILSMAAGASCYLDSDNGNFDKLYSRADAAMYEDKQRRKSAEQLSNSSVGA